MKREDRLTVGKTIITKNNMVVWEFIEKNGCRNYLLTSSKTKVIEPDSKIKVMG